MRLVQLFLHQMKTRIIFVVAIFVSSTLIGCDRRESTATVPMSTEQVIHQYRNSPIGDSIGPITQALAAQSVFVGTEGVTPTREGKIIDKIRLKTGVDNQGRSWVYAYTSRAEFSKAFPDGGPFTELSFSDLFAIAEKDQKFAGIFLNSASDSYFPIPRELFGDVSRALQRP